MINKSSKIMNIFKMNLRNVVAIATCLAAMTMFTSCEKGGNKQEESHIVDGRIVGKWLFGERDGVTLEITESKIMLLPVVPNPTPMETRTYTWVANDTIEITQQGWGTYITRNKIIFHAPDKVTIKGWFVRNNEVDVPIYADITIERFGK
jgi:hypothetical protein